MEQLIAKLVQDFEQGRISRRQLIVSLALTAAASGVRPVNAADGTKLKASGIHHVSYQVADYGKSRDFYASLLGAPVSEDTGKQCVLTMGDLRFIVRNGEAGRTPLVDHIAYSFENWNQEAMVSELKRRGLSPQPEGENSLQLRDPDGYHVQLSAKR